MAFSKQQLMLLALLVVAVASDETAASKEKVFAKKDYECGRNKCSDNRGKCHDFGSYFPDVMDGRQYQYCTCQAAGTGHQVKRCQDYRTREGEVNSKCDMDATECKARQGDCLALSYPLPENMNGSSYTIHAQITRLSEYFDVLEPGVFEWRLAFRGTPGIGTSAWDTYRDRQTTDDVEPECRKVTTEVKCTHHFRNNDVMDNWADIDQVLFVVYKGGERKAQVKFHGAGTDYLSWFSKDRVISSSWADITDKSVKKNYFSIKGHLSAKRSFFMNFCYGGCRNDTGWFVSVEDFRACDWEKKYKPRGGKFPVFLYATKHKMTNWSQGYVRTADVIAVFVKYNK